MRRVMFILVCMLALAILWAGQALADFTYVVQPGDTLSSIARQFNTTVAALVAANDLENPDYLRNGQRLTIPGDPPVIAPAVTPPRAPSGPWPTATPPTRVANNPAAGAQRATITARERLGVYGGADQLTAAWQAGLRAGSLIGSGVDVWTALPAGVTRWQVVRVSARGYRPGAVTLRSAIAAAPGAIWVIGNEPDVIWQDNVTPERYAAVYHELYTLIKAQDPTARVAIAGVATPTPLRRSYLDRVLNAYRATHGVPLPVDIWTVHTYILNEQRNSWGAEIPPGLTNVTVGNRYEVADHGDLAELTRMLADYRAWMAARGYRNVPLAVTEFGILMPADYGYPPDIVARYMRELVAYFQNASDPATGYPSDGNRLVQWWFWFSISDQGGEFGVSDLYDATTGRLTPIGWTYAGFWR